MTPVICIEMLYPGRDANEKIERIADHGFDAVEFWGWRDKDIDLLAQTCTRRGVRVANFSGHRVGSPIARETHERLLTDLRDAVATAQTLGCRTLMLLSNELGEGGAVMNSYPALSDDEKFDNFVRLLEIADAQVPAQFTLVIEPLNTLVDHRGNYLADMETAARLVDSISSPRVRILCDLYHLGVMGDDPAEVLRSYLPKIGYIHVADFPGRHEPGTGSADWEHILRLLKDSAYRGDVGFEYKPQGDSDESLEIIRSLVR